MADLQFLTTATLLSFALLTFLQTLSLSGKRKIAGVFSLLCILSMLSFSILREWGETRATFPQEEKPIEQEHEKSSVGMKFYVKQMQKFFSEMENLENSVKALSEIQAHSEAEQEINARKALSLRERSHELVLKIQQITVPKEAKEIQESIYSAAESLHLAAFALHAEISSDDASFRLLQKAQRVEQFENAKSAREETLQMLSKLAPNFFKESMR